MLRYLLDMQEMWLSNAGHRFLASNAHLGLPHIVRGEWTSKVGMKYWAVKLIAADKGLQFTPDPTQSLHCFVDECWWLSRSHFRHVSNWFCHFLCWLSSCVAFKASKWGGSEAGYFALSQSWRDFMITLLGLLAELQKGFTFTTSPALLSCSLFEDIAGALASAIDHNTCPHTKHTGLKYHHFRLHGSSGLVSSSLSLVPLSRLRIYSLNLLSAATFFYLQEKWMGW